MVKAIETTYAGCRFRSRLEARWAVFFDALGVEWQYEPERVEVHGRLTLKEESYEYLPDFWLPKRRLWVEVKGSWTESQCLWFLDAAASLSGGCRSNSPDVLICGPFSGHRHNWPGILHMHKGDLRFDPWFFDLWTSGECSITDVSLTIARDVGGTFEDIAANGDLETPAAVSGRLLEGWDINPKGPLRGDPLGARMHGALDAARSARFEHGELEVPSWKH